MNRRSSAPPICRLRDRYRASAASVDLCNGSMRLLWNFVCRITSPSGVALAKVATAAGEITGIVDFRKPLVWLNERSEILVGPVGNHRSSTSCR